MYEADTPHVERRTKLHFSASDRWGGIYMDFQFCVNCGAKRDKHQRDIRLHHVMSVGFVGLRRCCQSMCLIVHVPAMRGKSLNSEFLRLASASVMRTNQQ